MTAAYAGAGGPRTDAGGSTPGWLVIADRGIRDLWLGGRGVVLMLAFSLLLSALTYLAATNEELNLLDQKGTVNLVMQVALAVGVALSLLLSADAVSGERERGTLEHLLLTPSRPREIAIGKLLAALSVWPVVMAVTVPYLWIVRGGPGIFADAVIVGVVMGGLLTLAFASLGIIVSTFSNSNRNSLAVSFFIFVALVVPTQLPGGALQGWLGELVIKVNPVTAGAHFVERIIVSNHTWGQEATLLIAPILAALIALVAAVILTGRLRLHGGLGR